VQSLKIKSIQGTFEDSKQWTALDQTGQAVPCAWSHGGTDKQH